MKTGIVRSFASVATVAVLALSGAAPALAAKRHRHSHAQRHSTNSSTNSSTSTSSGETALTGSTLSSASAAALTAVPGGNVTSATTEADSSNSAAAYEVHVTKTDGSHVVVIEDSSFSVLSTAAQSGHGNCSGAAGGTGSSTSGTATANG